MKRLIIDCGQKHSLQLSGLFSGLVLLTRWFICGVCYSDAHIYRTDPIRSVLVCAAVKLKLRELVCIIIIILHVCWKGLLVGLITPPVYDSKQQLKIRLYTDNTYCTFPLMLSWMHNVIESVRGSEQQAVDSDLSETRGRDKIELPAFSVVTSRGRLYWLFLVPSNRCRCRWARSQSDHTPPPPKKNNMALVKKWRVQNGRSQVTVGCHLLTSPLTVSSSSHTRSHLPLTMI